MTSKETRSIKIEDINRALGGITVTYPEEGQSGTGTVTLNTDNSKTNIGATTEYPSYTYKNGDYSPESYPSTVGSEQIGAKVQANEYDYEITDDGRKLHFYYLINKQSSNSLIPDTFDVALQHQRIGL